jgi:hypothetical protein
VKAILHQIGQKMTDEAYRNFYKDRAQGGIGISMAKVITESCSERHTNTARV